MIYLVSQARSRGASRSTRSRRTSHAFRNVRGVGSRRNDGRLAGRDRHEGRGVRTALGRSAQEAGGGWGACRRKLGGGAWAVGGAAAPGCEEPLGGGGVPGL